MTPDPAAKHWDAIVIGTGMGGGSIGRRLAEAGKSVLFLERGPMGQRAEQQGLDMQNPDPIHRQTRGWWPTPLHARINGTASRFFGAIGSGVGGSSVFYAATLEQPGRHDIEPTPDRPHPTGGWPVSYDDLAPYYDKARAQFHVCGTDDPLSDTPMGNLAPPPPMDPGDQAMMSGFQSAGLHPYYAHTAIRFVPGCKLCLGFKCPKRCKMDSRSAGVEPALETGNAVLLDNCEVTALRGGTDGISHVEALRDGETLTFTADRYILSAGAFGSPRLMLASRSDAWPQGCGNGNGQVGRNLMFHLNEMFAIWPDRGVTFSGPSKSISLRDLYFRDGDRFGTVQAQGIDASYGEILHFLRMMLDRSRLARLRILKELARIPAMIAERMFGSAKVYVGIMEDLPYAENRVLLDETDPSRLCFEYQYSDELLRRRRKFRKLIKRAFRQQRTMFLTYQPELNFGHGCGTVRFGDDPKTSVLDRNCQSHEVRNLFVVDAAFMPTSLGVNPSLTIAANALRVADHILSKDADD